MDGKDKSEYCRVDLGRVEDVWNLDEWTGVQMDRWSYLDQKKEGLRVGYVEFDELKL